MKEINENIEIDVISDTIRPDEDISMARETGLLAFLESDTGK